jgi:hypothetical protein
MKTRILLLATLIAIGLASCSSKDDEPKQEESIENNLSNDALRFTGYLDVTLKRNLNDD